MLSFIALKNSYSTHSSYYCCDMRWNLFTPIGFSFIGQTKSYSTRKSSSKSKSPVKIRRVRPQKSIALKDNRYYLFQHFTKANLLKHVTFQAFGLGLIFLFITAKVGPALLPLLISWDLVDESLAFVLLGAFPLFCKWLVTIIWALFFSLTMIRSPLSIPWTIFNSASLEPKISTILFAKDRATSVTINKNIFNPFRHFTKAKLIELLSFKNICVALLYWFLYKCLRNSTIVAYLCSWSGLNDQLFWVISAILTLMFRLFLKGVFEAMISISWELLYKICSVTFNLWYLRLKTKALSSYWPEYLDEKKLLEAEEKKKVVQKELNRFKSDSIRKIHMASEQTRRGLEVDTNKAFATALSRNRRTAKPKYVEPIKVHDNVAKETNIREYHKSNAYGKTQISEVWMENGNIMVLDLALKNKSIPPLAKAGTFKISTSPWDNRN